MLLQPFRAHPTPVPGSAKTAGSPETTDLAYQEAGAGGFLELVPWLGVCVCFLCLFFSREAQGKLFWGGVEETNPGRAGENTMCSSIREVSYVCPSFPLVKRNLQMHRVLSQSRF